MQNYEEKTHTKMKESHLTHNSKSTVFLNFNLNIRKTTLES